jgi:pyruvate/2-oxoglutarate dehydrogenase complex dihydrolipoamide dehydrogenase (E3) component
MPALTAKPIRLHRKPCLKEGNSFKTRRQYDCEVAVLGGGSAGYAAARTAAAAGLRTVVIENGKEVGGLCILRGCMPTKALLYAAEVLHGASHAGAWGIRVGQVGFDFAKVMARKRRLIQGFADDRRAALAGGQFKFIRAQARFLDPHSVALTNGKTLTAAHFVITTGSSVAPPPLPQLAEVGYLTSDGALKLKRLPKSLLVLGGGPVAVEFAQLFARFGVRVTLLQRSAHLLSKLDTDAAMALEKVFRREGIKLITHSSLIDARRDRQGKTVSFQRHGRAGSASAEEILFALGRVPNTASLDLDKVGVTTEHGRIVANECMQTNAPHIYAAGDCTGLHEIVHLAVQQGEVAAHNIAQPKAPRRLDYRLLLAVIFTEPQVAFVGLTEKTANARGVRCLTARYAFRDHGKSLLMDARDGFVKLLAHPRSGEILGGACVGPVGGELIHEIVVALAKRMTVHELAALPHYHPTLAEIWTYPAEALAQRIPARQ